MSRVLLLSALLVFAVTGCAAAPRPLWVPREDAPVWPAAPDVARIRYRGLLTGEASLDKPRDFWQSVRAALTGGPPPVVFVRPTAVAVADPLVFVADPGAGVVCRLNLETRDFAVITGPPGDPFDTPLDVVIAGDRLLVVDRGRAAVDAFDLGGTHRDTLRHPELTAPTGLAYAAAHEITWITDVARHGLFILTGDGTLDFAFGQRGTQPGAFNFPSAAAWHPGAGLAVADALNFRVQLFDAAGAIRSVFGRQGDAAGDFARPRDLAFDADGHLHVLDNRFENVQIFTPAGQLLLAYGMGGELGPGRFALPAGITIDAQCRVWIADSYHGCVQVFEYLPATLAEES